MRRIWRHINISFCSSVLCQFNPANSRGWRHFTCSESARIITNCSVKIEGIWNVIRASSSFFHSITTPISRLSPENKITAKYTQQRQQLYDSYGTDASGFSSYRSGHKKELDSYLALHSDVDQELQDVVDLMKNQVDVFEGIKENLMDQ